MVRLLSEHGHHEAVIKVQTLHSTLYQRWLLSSFRRDFPFFTPLSSCPVFSVNVPFLEEIKTFPMVVQACLYDVWGLRYLKLKF